MNTVRGEVQVGVVGLCRNDPPGVPNEPPYPIQICFSHTDRGPVGLGQYDGPGEYCGPHTAPSVFLILVLWLVFCF